MKTRDGVTLYSDIYRPRAEGKFPVILMRTPYDKSVSWAVTRSYQQIAGHGYEVVVRNVLSTSPGGTFSHWNDS